MPFTDPCLLLSRDNICTLVSGGHSSIYGGFGFLKNFNIDLFAGGAYNTYVSITMVCVCLKMKID